MTLNTAVVLGKSFPAILWWAVERIHCLKTTSVENAVAGHYSLPKPYNQALSQSCGKQCVDVFAEGSERFLYAFLKNAPVCGLWKVF